MNLNERLLDLRKKTNLSQEEVATKLNVSRQTVSKWETGESKPDFDKIMPICELYNITPDELVMGATSKIESSVNNIDNKKKTAKIVAISVFFYFIALIWIIVSSSIDFISEELLVGIFFLICAGPTCMLAYHFISTNKETEPKKEKEEKYEKIDGVIALVFTAIYLSVSFATMRWDITWILWIIFAIVVEIIHLILDTKGKDKNE